VTNSESNIFGQVERLDLFTEFPANKKKQFHPRPWRTLLQRLRTKLEQVWSGRSGKSEEEVAAGRLGAPRQGVLFLGRLEQERVLLELAGQHDGGHGGRPRHAQLERVLGHEDLAGGVTSETTGTYGTSSKLATTQIYKTYTRGGGDTFSVKNQNEKIRKKWMRDGAFCILYLFKFSKV